jgi:sugar O-acyltransferase (sialic acid O-acetyltransferase NeuD family)
MRNLVIFGAGGHGRDILQVVRAINAISPTWQCVGFVVDPEYQAPSQQHDLPVMVGLQTLSAYSNLDIVVAVGDPNGREQTVERLKSFEMIRFPKLIHPQTWIGDRVRLGEGTIVFAGAMISTDVELGAHVHVNLSSTISHDTRIGPFSSLSPGVNIAGRVKIGARAQIGTAASIIPGVEVGDDCIVGAGAAVIRSMPRGVTAVGVPARIIRPRQPKPDRC